jgi:hypothetical protein
MVLPNQLSKPGTTRLAPSNCATKFILALKDTVVPTVRPKRLRIVLGASNNPAARISMTIIWTINKIRNFIRSSSLLYKFKSCLQDTTFLIPFQAPTELTGLSKLINAAELCYNAANMQYELRFANNDNNDNDDLRIVGRSLAG